jgi:hypothetical protein
LTSQRTILTYKEIAGMTGIKVTSLRKRLCIGTMPKPDLRVGGSPVWYPETLTSWLSTAAPGARPSNRKDNRTNATV